MDRFQAISAFSKVVETGSFARAADRLGVSVSSVSRQVAELEAHLDARLLNRTTRKLSLTETGRVFHERCVQLLADLEEAEQSAAAGTVRPRGTLRLSAPVTFGTRYMAGPIADFMRLHPDMRFDVQLSDRAVDLVEEGYDLAVRIGSIGSRTLVGRRVGVTRMVCCAAPAYLAHHGEPHAPEELAEHVALAYEYSPMGRSWVFRDDAGHERRVEVRGPLQANNGRLLAALAVAGAGIVFEPDFIVGPDLRAGRLVPLLAGFRPPAGDIYIVYPSRRHLSAKVRAFTDYLAQRFAQPEWAADEGRTRHRARAGGVVAADQP